MVSWNLFLAKENIIKKKYKSEGHKPNSATINQLKMDKTSHINKIDIEKPTRLKSNIEPKCVADNYTTRRQ